ncbi:EamA family transporter RarD [Pollutimonas nitritireducens]|uniref:EamA family transporter RarD n=1 Tax=Pollutimonas nitritireducens TaxID=2045209 RepID=UPI0026A8589E
MSPLKQGVALSVISSILFATLYYYTTLLYPLEGGAIFAWRVLLGLPAVALLVSRARGWGEVGHTARRLRYEPRLWLLLGLSAVLIGTQLLLFMWAPLHGRALDVSLGYFLLPLVMVLVGRFLYGERLTRIQTVAVFLAACGVGHELLRADAFSWATAVVMLGYPPYFILRRILRMGALSALWFDMLFMLPAALWLLSIQDGNIVDQLRQYPGLWGLIPLLGLISSAALVSYVSASRKLPMGLFGILGYIEPMLLFWVAFLLLDEPMAAAAWFTYLPIWMAVLMMIGEGLYRWIDSAAK